jgi:r-opsin
MTISLWFMAWTPYLIINFTGVLTKTKISPLATIWGSLFAKANAVYNPIVYGISHPKYRLALQKKYPALACASEPEPVCDAQSVATAATEEKPSA